MTKRTCMDCRESFNESDEFFPRNPRSGYLRRRCYLCWREYRKTLVNPETKRAAQAAYFRRNKVLIAEKQRIYYAANREKRRSANRTSQLKHEYGLTMEQYQTLLDAQGGTCAICSSEQDDFLCVDHDHETGAIRGLLCRLCNSALGRFGDDEAGVLHALDYLRSAESRIGDLLPDGPAYQARSKRRAVA